MTLNKNYLIVKASNNKCRERERITLNLDVLQLRSKLRSIVISVDMIIKEIFLILINFESQKTKFTFTMSCVFHVT